MKLEEILEDKTEDAKTLVKMLRLKAKRRNPIPSKSGKFTARGAEDSYTGYSLATFAQANWN